ncbi:MAG: hypothetical protein ABSB96_00720 [Gaiellaceae bacterium]
MRTKVITRALVAVLLVALAASCGGNKSTAKTTSTANTITTKPPPAATFKAVFKASSHHPVVNKNWPITVTVASLTGKPIAATLQMNVLFAGAQVGQIDNGKIYHFVGRYHENITWPVDAIGHLLTLQAVVKVNGKTQKLLWPVSVVSK